MCRSRRPCCSAGSAQPLERGAWFLSVEHDQTVISETLAAVTEAAGELKRKGIL